MLTNVHHPDHVCILHHWTKHKLRSAIKALPAHEAERPSRDEYSLVVKGRCEDA